MKHFKLAILVTTGLLTAAAAAQAQEKRMEAPKPSPEVKKLGYFAGDWTTEGEMKPGPWGAGGKMTGLSHCSWMQGGFFLVCTDDATSASVASVSPSDQRGPAPAVILRTARRYSTDAPMRPSTPKPTSVKPRFREA